MKAIVHRIAGGLAGISVAALIPFLLDATTRPTHWAIPAMCALVVVASTGWLASRPSRGDTDIERTFAVHSGAGNINQGSHVEYHHHGVSYESNDEASRAKAQRLADKQTYKELVELVTRDEVRFLEEHDFGAVWDGRSVEPLYQYAHTRNAVEHEFHDPALEELRKRFHGLVDDFAYDLAGNSVSTGKGRGSFELIGKDRRRFEPPKGAHYEAFEERRKRLNASADLVVQAYNDLVREARKRAP